MLKMRLNGEHHEVIVTFAEIYPGIITNRFVGLNSKFNGQKLWEELTNKLNALGYGELSTAEYKRRLTDWKSKVKGKAVHNDKSLNKTGGGERANIVITKVEERLLALMGNKSYEGENIPEMGFFNQCGKIKGPQQKKNKEFLGEKIAPTNFSIEPPQVHLGSPSFFNKPFQSTTTSQSCSSSIANHSNNCVIEEIVLDESNSYYIDEPHCYDIEHNYKKRKPEVEANKENNQEDSNVKLNDKTPHKTPSTSTNRRREVMSMTESINKINDKTLNVLGRIDNKLDGINNSLLQINKTLEMLTFVLKTKNSN